MLPTKFLQLRTKGRAKISQGDYNHQSSCAIQPSANFS